VLPGLRSDAGATREGSTSKRPGGERGGQEDRLARKELQRLDRQIERLTTREAELSEQLAANATDYEKLTALGADLRAIQAEKSALEDRWLELAADT
jgi:ATP-binding cassette subfamily F protein uup